MKNWIGLTVAMMLVASLQTSTAKNIGLKVPFQPDIDYGNANLIVDALLFKVNRNLPPYIELGDLGGPFDFTDCLFVGVDHGIHRNGDATMFTSNDIVQFNSEFKMNDIGINCTWHYRELLMRGQCDALTELVQISSGMVLLVEQGQHPYLTEFLVKDMAAIKTQITGLTPAFNWLAEDITNFILSVAEDEITLVIQTILAELIQDILDTVIVP